MKNCIIIHGSPSSREKGIDPEKRTYDKHWIPWTKKELISRGIKTKVPLMPEPWEPKYSEWKKNLEKLNINEESILVGHSSGGGFLVRWLGDTNKKIKKLILVAPAIIHSGQYKPLNDLLKFKINKEIKNNIREIIIFVSKDDSIGIRKSVEIFSNALGVKPREFEDRGHFTLGDMETEEFPELIEAIIK